MRDRQPVGVDDRGERDVVGVEARLEDRAQSGIGRAAPGMGSHAVADHLTRTMVNGVGQQFGARTALVEADLRQPRQVHQAQHDDHGAHDRS